MASQHQFTVVSRIVTLPDGFFPERRFPRNDCIPPTFVKPLSKYSSGWHVFDSRVVRQRYEVWQRHASYRRSREMKEPTCDRNFLSKPEQPDLLVHLSRFTQASRAFFGGLLATLPREHDLFRLLRTAMIDHRQLARSSTGDDASDEGCSDVRRADDFQRLRRCCFGQMGRRNARSRCNFNWRGEHPHTQRRAMLSSGTFFRRKTS